MHNNPDQFRWPPRTFILPLFCLLSGIAALFYQILWSRAFAIILGSTVQAAALTVVTYFIGLSLGAFVFGRVAAKQQSLLPKLMLLELAIAVCAVGAGFGLQTYATTLAVFIGHAEARLYFAAPLALILILPPTLLIGGSLPLVFSIARQLDRHSPVVGSLYGFNTFGAALGTLICGFFSIRWFGVFASYLIAGTCNVIAATLCLRLFGLTTNKSAPRKQHQQTHHLLPEYELLAIAAMSGLTVLSMEIAWIRLAGLLIGNRVFAFSTLLFCVLVCLALGSWLSTYLYQRYYRKPALLFGWIFFACTFGITISWLGVVWWTNHQTLLESQLFLFPKLALFYRFVETAILVFPAFLPLGILFPLSLNYSRHAKTQIGRATGYFYLTNTLGAVVGATGVGFWAVREIGTAYVIGVFVFFVLFWALGLFVQAARHGNVTGGLAGLFASLFLASGIIPHNYSLNIDQSNRQLVFAGEDEYGIFRLLRLPNDHLVVINNKTELVFHLGTIKTSYVQQMQGHLGMFYNPQATAALVLGSGYGITAGTLGIYPQIKSVDAVELLPFMVATAKYYVPYNLNYHKNAKVQIHLNDGRFFLAKSTAKYDIISVNLSDPHLPGATGLFHREFYALAKEHLSSSGVLIQHAFGSNIGIILATLADSFPYLRLIPSYGDGYNVVASLHPLTLDSEQVQHLASQPAVSEILATIGIFPPLTAKDIVIHAFKPEDLPNLFKQTAIATDNNPLLEFAWNARGIKNFFINE